MPLRKHGTSRSADSSLGGIPAVEQFHDTGRVYTERRRVDEFRQILCLVFGYWDSFDVFGASGFSGKTIALLRKKRLSDCLSYPELQSMQSGARLTM